jgi:hypothetical protein
MLMKDIDSAYNSKFCEYCNRYKDRIRVTRLIYARGRKLRYVTTCWECLDQPEFYGRNNGEPGRIYTVDQYAEVYSSIEQVVREVGKPIALVEAVKIAASRDPKVRAFYDVDVQISEEDPGLWELIYHVVANSSMCGIVPLVTYPNLIVHYKND